jgi:outer membrane protein OmpA-like peptidoglycan-associated protein
MKQAKEKNAEFYAPSSFQQATRYYTDATEEYSRGGKIESINEKVRNASLYLSKALDACKTGEATLSKTSVERDAAKSAGAPLSHPDLWAKAEEKFKESARRLEDGRTDDAKALAAEAEIMYGNAELEAIKSNYLAPTTSLLKQADEVNAKKEAPRTLARAESLSAKVIDILKQNRYDADEARVTAQQAKYEASHALYLHSLISAHKDQNESLEDLILRSEALLQRVATTLGIRSQFDKGFDPAVSEINGEIKTRDQKIGYYADSLRQLAEIIRSKENENSNLKEQIGSMQGRLGTLSESEKKLQEEGKSLEQKLYVKLQQDETIKQVAATFTDEEGNTLRDGDNIIIRLYGLSFPVGKNTIDAQYYPLLTKVQDAIKKFPNCTVRIEGHTDSQGSDELNQTLSESRAKAVAEYLMANMSVQVPVNSQGFGETRPVASNDTPEGRAKNRRIDVVITPEWAGK